jgi:hypothetical protein
LHVSGNSATIRDPNLPAEDTIDVDDLLLRCGGVLLEVRRGN